MTISGHSLRATCTFRDLWRLGYRRLVPIIPPNAAISERSSLLKRKDARGKAVGVRGYDGLWFGFDWLPHEATEDDLDRWQAMGAGIGIKTGSLDDSDSLVLIDADTLDLDQAKLIRDTIWQMIGPLPARIGQAPKCGYPVRVKGAFRYSRVEFGKLSDQGRLTSRVEILSDGRQFVGFGVHPATEKPYSWPRPLPAYDELPIVEPAVLTAFLAHLGQILPAARPIVTEGSTTAVDQAALRGKSELVRKAVEAIPNRSADFGTRESYRDFGYAIKAALPDDEALAFELFSEWCAKWEDGHNEPEIVEADWRRMKPPFRRGAGWIYELAELHAPERFNRAEQWFEQPADSSIFGEDEKAIPVSIAWLDPQAWEGRVPPPRAHVIHDMLPDYEVSLLTGAGGVGKTLLAQQMATHIATGLPFFGREVGQRKAMLFLCEDDENELWRRQQDINRSLGLTMADLSNLRIASRKFMDNLLSVWDRGSMKRTQIWQALVDAAKDFGATFVVIDTIADTFGGSEIDRAQVRQFVQGCLGRLAQETGGAVLALGHPSRAGQSSGEGTSGSTAWHASVRSRLYLNHARKDETGPIRTLANKKANYGPMGDQWKLRWRRGVFEVLSAKTVSTVEAHFDPASAAEGVPPLNTQIPETADVIDAAVLSAIDMLAADGVRVSDAQNSSYYAPKILAARASELLGHYTAAEVECAWLRVLGSRLVEPVEVGRDAKRRAVTSYRVAAVRNAAVFD